jgi:alkyl hydroperoxide reductase subunit AhpF
MTSAVKLLFFTQILDCETCLTARQILDELPALSAKITIEEADFVLEKDKAATYGVDRVPAVVVLDANGNDTRIRFLGAPAGYEFVSLVQAVLLVGGHGSALTDENRKRLAVVDKPMTLQVFTTPT